MESIAIAKKLKRSCLGLDTSSHFYIFKLELLDVRQLLRLARFQSATKPQRSSWCEHWLYGRVTGNMLLEENRQERIEVHAFTMRRVIQRWHEFLSEDKQRRWIVRVVQVAQEIAHEG